jgi:hypothetical protein
VAVSNDIQQLVQEGRAAALAGDTFTARERFRRATELEPENVEAWIGLSSAVPRLAEKREYLQRALQIAPANTEAQASIQYVERLLAEGLQLAPSRRREEQHRSGNASPLLSTPEQPATEVEYCYRHAGRETGLHCVQCNRPICAECATPAPVGQLCPECRNARRPRNYQVSAANMIVGGVVAFFTALLLSIPVALFARGFFAIFIIIFAGPALAELIVRVVDYVTRLKRGRPMQIAVGVGIALGMLPTLWATSNIFLLFFMILAISVAVARLR